MTVVEVPQWRGSAAPTSERLREGARLLAGMVDADRRVRVEVDDDLVSTSAKVRAALADLGGPSLRPSFETDGLVVTAGGDCGVELQPVAAARKRYGDRLVVVWFDAHADMNSPASSPSGAYHGMVLRALTGDGPEGLVPEQPLRPRQIVLAGVRDLDPGELAFVRDQGIRHLPPVVDAAALVRAIEAVAEAPVVYVHIDLDVLDPRAFESVGSPTPGGLRPDELLALVTAVAERFPVAGLGLMEYEPSRKEDQELLAELVPRVVAACARS
ncbi:arginase family protein [Nonomuraea terrae]|uniref:arginase family protein n=1 Tax=Nonomuraea terrae TaxID=2530383 RepID=UPI00379F98A6